MAKWYCKALWFNLYIVFTVFQETVPCWNFKCFAKQNVLHSTLVQFIYLNYTYINWLLLEQSPQTLGVKHCYAIYNNAYIYS